MKNRKKYTPILFLLLSMSLINSTCKKEKYDDVIYFDATGVGYAFIFDYRDSIWYPAHGAEITITTSLKGSGGLFSPPLPKETFITDTTGKYEVRFIKRTQLSDAIEYYFDLDCFSCKGPLYDKLTNVYSYFPEYGKFSISVDGVKNIKHTIALDTIKISIFKQGW
ncbi:MAG: hypothetical protein FWG79_03385 [Bacteroidales bacterium]|nr:hypothetical protein [Bacteroidales bacterium]